ALFLLAFDFSELLSVRSGELILTLALETGDFSVITSLPCLMATLLIFPPETFRPLTEPFLPFFGSAFLLNFRPFGADTVIDENFEAFWPADPLKETFGLPLVRPPSDPLVTLGFPTVGGGGLPPPPPPPPPELLQPWMVRVLVTVFE